MSIVNRFEVLNPTKRVLGKRKGKGKGKKPKNFLGFLKGRKKGGKEKDRPLDRGCVMFQTPGDALVITSILGL